MSENPAKDYIRTVEDVSKVINYAKLDEQTLLPITQAIYFADTLKNYKLLELNNDVLNELKNGNGIVFRGEKNEKAVLCTETKTYEVKEAETSNSLLLTPDLKFPSELQEIDCKERCVHHKNIVGVFHTYYEITLCKPKYKKLRNILEESSYRGSELESELSACGVHMYSTGDLLECVQTSKHELCYILKQIQAFELDGKWRILEFNYHFRVLSFFLNLIDDHSWKLDEIPYLETKEILCELMPEFILKYLFAIYTEESDKEANRKNEQLHKLLEYKICRFLGEALLRPTGRFGLDDFLKAWQESVPEGLMTDISQLNDLAFVDTASNPKAIYYYPHYELSEDVAERMQQLFTKKEKWTLDQIKPYIAPLTTNKMDENAILTKYARASNINGIKYYSTRHGK